MSIFPPELQQHFQKQNSSSNSYNLDSNDFSWSDQVNSHLRSTFRINTFRDHQKQIINATLLGHDVFVIMRTGGGKSLTYQLPALIEGRGSHRKITLVISPLVSLIRDQEDQMNAFCAGSATSFTSGMRGGASEHSKRWGLLRDANSGICIVFVTPEKVSKSRKLRGEMEKLLQQGRLGRFVIDECHCACQWGHDFRPDYTQLGILKKHFPSIPLIAVTATASDRVRKDCCDILNIAPNYKFFRSSANRPNLTYSIKAKADGHDKVIDDIANFIKEHHLNQAGIIYTFSRKEADEVADKLSSRGIIARSYHSSVSDSVKESVHRSWMKNRTQVVVATIAFGLGINKPDVRFVLHHSLSKSLEAYYQESGRAGRDGKPANCVLYYSVKDISRMIGMIHGENGEGSFWSMVKYGQEYGNDALCKRIILSTLGEPGCSDVDEIIAKGSENPTTEVREVGRHAKNIVQLIQSSAKDLTIQQLVSTWRGKDAPDFIKEHPPGKDLNKEECERLVASLLVSDILRPKVVFTSYSAIVYIGLKDEAALLISSPNPKVRVRFPIKKKIKTTLREAKAKRTANIPSGNGWISTKRPAAKTRKDQKKLRRITKTKGKDSKVIDISDDSDSIKPVPHRGNKRNSSVFLADSTDDDEFDL